MMHACHRLMEDRSPGLLKAANLKLEAVEFQAGVPPPRTSDNTVTYPTEQEREIDNVMGDENEARVAAEAP